MREVVRPSLPENCNTVLVTLDRKPKTEMDKEAAARIQSAEAKKTTVKLKKEPLPPALSVRQTRMKQRRTKKGNEPESDNKP